MATSGLLENIAIRGIACAVPGNQVDNSVFADCFGAEAVESFAKMTGVTSRYAALSEQTTSDLACVAASRLLDNISWFRDTLDGIIFVTQTPDYTLPATACVLHHRLGLDRNCLAFDVNLGCSGFVYGLFVAGSLCRKDQMTRILLCGGDTITKLVAEEDKSAAMLFGDSGFAVALEYCDSAKPWNYLFRTDGNGYKNIIVPAGNFRHPAGNREIREFGEGILRGDHNLYMNGINVFNFTISEVPKAIKQLMAFAGKTPEDIDLLVLHQANLFILKNIAKMTKFSMSKVPVSMDRYGNTSVASIPLTLCDALSGKLDMGNQQLVLAGFGVGLSWGVISLELDPAVCLPVAYSNDSFKDGDVEL
jgi:3-oxoacyl-[acyl-carrier-protein] synthase III